LDIGAIEEEEKDIVKLTTRVLPVPMWRMRGATLPLPHKS
jgi:hypothetical protein